MANLTKRIELELTREEALVLIYVIVDAASPYACDPLKDIYELEQTEGEIEDPYGALKSAAKKLFQATKGFRK